MPEFKVGEIVNITIEGVEVTNSFKTGVRPLGGPTQDTGTVLVFRHPDEGLYDRSHTVNLKAAGVTVERADPEWWPPQPGDLLRHDHGRHWFATAFGSNVALITAHSHRLEPQQAWAQRHELSLVHRETEPSGGDDA